MDGARDYDTGDDRPIADPLAQPARSTARQDRDLIGQVDPESEIGQALSRLADAVQGVDHAAEQLERGLDPVLTERDEDFPEDGELARAQTTPLGRDVDDFAARLQRVERRLRHAYHRLEL